MNKIFITGTGGLTGYKLSLLVNKKYDVFGSYNFRNPDLSFVNSVKMDLRDYDRVRNTLKDIMPDILINTVAINSVDYCEMNKGEAEETNVKAVANLFRISNELGIKLIHISSDSVFDGTKKEPYIETDNPNPINVYGITKLQSEKIVMQNPKNLVVRASVLYGWLPKFLADQSSSSLKSTNFGQWLITKLIANEKVKIVTDELSSPIIADDLAAAILNLIEWNCFGIFHCAPNIRVSRYDFSIDLAKFFNLNLSLIEKTTISELGRKVSTGMNKCLNSNKIHKKTNFEFLSLENSFKLLKEQSSS